jgi:hypothetical protein
VLRVIRRRKSKISKETEGLPTAICMAGLTSSEALGYIDFIEAFDDAECNDLIDDASTSLPYGKLPLGFRDFIETLDEAIEYNETFEDAYNPSPLGFIDCEDAERKDNARMDTSPSVSHNPSPSLVVAASC